MPKINEEKQYTWPKNIRQLPQEQLIQEEIQLKESHFVFLNRVPISFHPIQYPSRSFKSYFCSFYAKFRCRNGACIKQKMKQVKKDSSKEDLKGKKYEKNQWTSDIALVEIKYKIQNLQNYSKPLKVYYNIMLFGQGCLKCQIRKGQNVKFQRPRLPIESIKRISDNFLFKIQLVITGSKGRSIHSGERDVLKGHIGYLCQACKQGKCLWGKNRNGRGRI